MAIKNYGTNVGSLKDHVFVSVIFMNLILSKEYQWQHILGTKNLASEKDVLP